MAAKVVIMAVPTVLGIASIRVYTVKEAPADGLISREKLNIYTTLPQSTQTQFAPEKPGFIQNGVTATREGILPAVQTIKGACVFLKDRSVNLYHAGNDVYHYLKDPPPEFLPRFGTITMAGLLGMFLARKGSHFKRVVIPLGLMSAGASVCYPAQTVAVLKVTGKKMYAAGQWSSASLSSLLTPTPQKPVTIEPAPPQPKAATVSNPDSTVVEETSEVQSFTIPQTTAAGSAKSVPVSDEPAVAVTSEVATSEKDPEEQSVLAGTKNITTSEEIPTPVEKPCCPEVSCQPSVSEPAPQPEVADPTEVAPMEETPDSAITTPTHQQPSTEDSKGGAGFQADPALMDFGQSNPEDEDLYSTRS